MNGKNKTKLPLIALGGFFLFVLDQIFKYFARTNPQTTYYLWKPWLGWEYYANSGIAFDIPVPSPIVLGLTPLILLGLIIIFLRKKNPSRIFIAGAILIILGAVSNFIDRMLFGITVDYLRVFTSVLNIGDLMILAGVILLLFKNKKL